MRPWWLVSLLTRLRDWWRQPTTHHLTRFGRQLWHPSDGGLRAYAVWFADGFPWLEPGDYVILAHPESRQGTTRYRVTRYWGPCDPGDQHFVNLEFAPREATP